MKIPHHRADISVGALILCLISMCFTAAVYKINDSNIGEIASVQKQAEATGRRVKRNCEFDVRAINQAHKSIKAGFTLNARIAQDNVDAIDYGFKNGLIPDNLRAYYVGVRTRQADNRDQFDALAAVVYELRPIC